MMLKRLRTTLVVVLIVYGGYSNAVSGRKRQCCGYSMRTPSSSLCSDTKGCIIMSPNENNDRLSAKSLPLEQCQIKSDSKLQSNKEAIKEGKLECMAQKFQGDDIREAQVVYGIMYGSSTDDTPGQQVEYDPKPKVEIDDSIPLPFSIHPYILTNPKASELPALEVRVAYGGADMKHPLPSPWSQLRFRILNRNHCSLKLDDAKNDPSLLDSCLPRCVSASQGIESETDSTRSGSKEPVTSQNFGSIFAYDCEVGIWVPSGTNDEQSHMTHSTSGDPYEIDLCMAMESTEGKKELCGSYLFKMPYIDDIDPSRDWDDLVLLEKAPLFDDQTIVLYFPPNYNGPRNVVLLRTEIRQGEEEPSNRYLIKQFSSSANTSRASFYVSDYIKAGLQYEIVLTKNEEMIEEGNEWTDDVKSSLVASFSIDPNDPKTRGATIAAVLIVLIVVTALIVIVIYFQYKRVKKNHKVDPKRLLESGRISAKNILVITNLDNRHHIDIVLAFNKYLKAHCGVGETIFAPDTETGIASQTDQDPWKWAQDTADKIEKEEGHIVFIGAPPTGMGITIYKDFPNNQAFISTKILKDMADKNRISVIMFPYSDSSTIPSTLPSHLKGETIAIPGRGMNQFLCRLLEVKKRVLCACLPFPIIRPEVSPKEFTHYQGGNELLQRITELSEKVDAYKKQCDDEAQHADEVAPLNNESSHHISIIKPEKLKASVIKNAQNVKNKFPSVSVNIESKTISLKSKDIKNRDPDDIENC